MQNNMQLCLSTATAKLLLVSVLSASTSIAAVPVIFDTDMGNDVDDALALAMLHSLTDRGECRLIGVTLTNSNPFAVPYVRMFNRFYGRGDLPVGAAMKKLDEGVEDKYLSATLRSAPAALKRESDSAGEPAVRVLRRLLEQSTDKVAIVQVGFSSNLSALVGSGADDISPKSGMTLVREKVLLLSLMAGNFSGGKPEYNIYVDAAAARSLLERWPVPAVFSGFEIGLSLKYPSASIERDFRWAPWHPVVASYRAFAKMPYDRPTWDLTSVLYAARPQHGYFSLSDSGAVRVDDANVTPFVPRADGKHRYLKLDPAARDRVLEALTLLTSQPRQQDGAPARGNVR
jgi:inosine-uridine nucleoside N-ribohydrolase